MVDFYKYQGAGNDFIMIDNRNGAFKGDKVGFAKKWCSRKFGVGSDGVIFMENSEQADFNMDFYNPDGSQSFCGNGSRCAVAFAKTLKIITNQTTFEAVDGLHEGEIIGDQVKIKMNQYGPITAYQSDFIVQTGSPHYTREVNNVDDIDVVKEGQLVRYNDDFKENGINVNFIEKISDHQIKIRTYERGVEHETLACGTGATACGLVIADSLTDHQGVIEVAAKGGDLKIHFTKTAQEKVFADIFLEGPAEFVFKGEIYA